ncbi:WW domain-containing protein tag-325-like [Anopheles ziemanni]|uniref:WW domain-containing protein tag-325-like n=1 Tax=Anopheles coustani TaxID=139045 RepID=UPI00265A6A1A|nr:WW domain-containing protein tag-325-like [Anopheles coustani]XP_058169421.1 WW domain-containing protein tag-325-like [Anopheles ziemanni]
MDSYLGLAEHKLKPRSVVDAFSNRTGTVKKRPVRVPPPQSPKPRSVSQASAVVDGTGQFHYLLEEHLAVVEKNKRLEMRNSLLEEENTKLKSDIDNLRGAYEELQENLGSGTSKSFDTGKLLVHLKLKRRADKETLEKRNIIKNEACFNTYLQHVDMVENIRIPRIIHECVTVLETNEKFMRTTGLYRMSGNHKEIQKLRYAINAGDYKTLRKQKSPHEVCGILKLFLRELKDPLIPLETCNRIIPSVWLGSTTWPLIRRAKVRLLYSALDDVRQNTLKFLMKHLQRVATIEENEVDTVSLGVLFCSIIFNETLADVCPVRFQQLTVIPKECIIVMIEDYDNIFS